MRTVFEQYIDLQSLLGRLFFLRLVVISGLVVELSFSLPYPILEHTALTVTLITYGVLSLAGLAKLPSHRRKPALLAHLLVELYLFSLLMYMTGGVSNPAVSYFLLIVMLGAYNLKVAWSWLISGLAIGAYTVLLVWFIPIDVDEMRMPATHGYAHTTGHNDLFNWHLMGMWITFLISALGLTGLIPPLMQRDRTRRQEIKTLREQQLKHEQLIGIGTLAAGAAHELGTPLMTMNLLLEDAERLDNDDCALLKQQVALCRDALSRLSQTGRQSLTQAPQSVVLNQWLLALLQRWRLSHPSAQYDWTPKENGLVIWHSPLLDQALLNLLDNAAQAGEHPVLIEVKRQTSKGVISLIQSSSDAASQLADLGLFNTRKTDGMGIGFYLSNASVEQCGGSVHLTELPSGGTRCQITLPLVLE